MIYPIVILVCFLLQFLFFLFLFDSILGIVYVRWCVFVCVCVYVSCVFT